MSVRCVSNLAAFLFLALYNVVLGPKPYFYLRWSLLSTILRTLSSLPFVLTWIGWDQGCQGLFGSHSLCWKDQLFCLGLLVEDILFPNPLLPCESERLFPRLTHFWKGFLISLSKLILADLLLSLVLFSIKHLYVRFAKPPQGPLYTLSSTRWKFRPWLMGASASECFKLL